ncbi:SsgA family sporulation/cell division regulator [Streptomyces sp. NPDC002519]
MTKHHLSLEIAHWVLSCFAVKRHCEFSYDPDDPLAVSLDFGIDEAEPVRWVFSRDLLADGMAARTGEGDVVLWPARIGPDGTTPCFCLHLGSTRTALFEIPFEPVARWLAGTYALVPRGSELNGVDWNELAQPAE